MHRTIIVSCLLLIISFVSSCQLNWYGTEPTPTPTPAPLGPAVISNNPDVTIESWEYISPKSQNAITSFPSEDPQALKIEAAPYSIEAYILWNDTGFEIIWSGYICSTQPVLIINKSTVEVWPNDTFWEDCEAMSVPHAFSVELVSTVPQSEWRYIIMSGEALPPITPAQATQSVEIVR